MVTRSARELCQTSSAGSPVWTSEGSTYTSSTGSGALGSGAVVGSVVPAPDSAGGGGRAMGLFLAPQPGSKSISTMGKAQGLAGAAAPPSISDLVFNFLFTLSKFRRIRSSAAFNVVSAPGFLAEKSWNPGDCILSVRSAHGQPSLGRRALDRPLSGVRSLIFKKPFSVFFATKLALLE